MKSKVNIDGEETFQQVRDHVWLKHPSEIVAIRIIAHLPATPVSRPVGIPLNSFLP